MENCIIDSVFYAKDDLSIYLSKKKETPPPLMYIHPFAYLETYIFTSVSLLIFYF